MGSSSDWSTMEAKVGALVSNSALPDDLASQVRHFVKAVRDAFLPAEEVSLGYWRNSMRFCWVSRGIEVEVFSNELEFYRFDDGQTDVRHFAFARDGAVPPELIVELNKPGCWQGVRTVSGPLGST